MYVFLTGAPGSGKTAVAPHLARELGAVWLDLDDRITRAAGKSVARVFAEDGEARFRALEGEALRTLPDTYAWTVVATGGGAVVDPANRAAMRDKGVLVHLRARLATLASRTRGGDRPLLAGGGRERLRSLLASRRAAYADHDVAIDTDGRTPRAVALACAAALVAGRGATLDAGRPPYHVCLGALDELGAVARRAKLGARVVVVTDAIVGRRYGARALASLRAAGFSARVVRVPVGEAAKSAEALALLWRALARQRLGRDDAIVALGGGSVSDLAGFAAATYARGVAWIAAPTTLLGMVDAAIGGKTAIDLPEGKNLAGAFHEPRAVLADLAALESLPARERASGLAEIAKTAAVTDAAFFAQLERAAAALRDGASGALFAATVSAARAKRAVVARDPREESGQRLVLNFGHTLGHALEAATRYRRYTHGEAISLGMVFACALAEELHVARASLRKRVEALLDALGLPIRARVPDRAWALLARDKKRRAGKLQWVLPRGLGRVKIVADVPAPALRRAARTLEG